MNNNTQHNQPHDIITINISYLCLFYLYNCFLIFHYFYSSMLLRLYNNENITNHIINIIWKVLRYLTILYIWINNIVIQPTKKYLIAYCIHFVKNKKGITSFIIIRDGNEIMKFHNIHELIKKSSLLLKTDDVLYKIDDTLIVYSNVDTVISKMMSMSETKDKNVFKRTKFNFFNCYLVLKLKDKSTITTYIELKKFMIDGNKLLNTNFLIWYINHYTQNTLNINDIRYYVVNILDHHIRDFKLYINNYIEFKDDKYIVHVINEIEKNHDDISEDNDANETAIIDDNKEEDNDNETITETETDVENETNEADEINDTDTDTVSNHDEEIEEEIEIEEIENEVNENEIEIEDKEDKPISLEEYNNYQCSHIESNYNIDTDNDNINTDNNIDNDNTDNTDTNYDNSGISYFCEYYRENGYLDNCG